jgi:hypothetical protein
MISTVWIDVPADEQRDRALHDPSPKTKLFQNDWLEKRIFAGLHVLAEETDENIQLPENDVSPREQQWRYTGGGTGINPEPGDFLDIVVDDVFDCD